MILFFSPSHSLQAYLVELRAAPKPALLALVPAICSHLLSVNEEILARRTDDVALSPTTVGLVLNSILPALTVTECAQKFREWVLSIVGNTPGLRVITKKRHISVHGLYFKFSPPAPLDAALPPNDAIKRLFDFLTVPLPSDAKVSDAGPTPRMIAELLLHLPFNTNTIINATCGLLGAAGHNHKLSSRPFIELLRRGFPSMHESAVDCSGRMEEGAALRSLTAGRTDSVQHRYGLSNDKCVADLASQPHFDCTSLSSCLLHIQHLERVLQR